MSESKAKMAAVSLVSASDYRRRVLARLNDDPQTPTELEQATGIAISHVSRSLNRMREEGLVTLLVPEERSKGRYYGITDDGQAVLDWLDDRTVDDSGTEA